MRTWRESREVEARGLAVLVPYAKLRFPGMQLTHLSGQFFLDAAYGDFIFKHPNTPHALVEFVADDEIVEAKTEEKHTGNLFLEVWSNRTMEKPGWLYKSRADSLWYYFLDSDRLYRLNFRKLRVWALETFGTAPWLPNPGIEKRYELKQTRSDQLNDTWGRCVPIRELTEYIHGGGPEHPLAALNETGTVVGYTQTELLH